MVPKLHFPTHFPFYLLLLVFILCSIDSKAQCAGNDNTLPDVCNVLDPSSQTIDLSTLLGTHTSGGTWSDDDSSGGLDPIGGILNAQVIKKGGTYHYTYSLNNISGCTDSATVTITIGGYSGVGSATNACSDNANYSLFEAFNGGFPLPQEGGIWHDDTPSGGVDINEGTLDATIPPVRINYSYTYTIGAIGSCPQVSSTVHVYISPKPLSGNPSNLYVCSTNVNGYTNVDLNALLSGEDAGGTWTELSGTSEITFPADNAVNVQNIYAARGAGNYIFQYTVVPERPVCRPNAFTQVLISIEELIDLTAAKLTVNANPVCEESVAGTSFVATFTQGTKSIANGSYEVTYTISGAPSPIQVIANCFNGKLSFAIPSAYFATEGNYTVSIVNFRIVGSVGACNNIMGNTANTVVRILPTPEIDAATVTIAPVCLNNDATVVLSGTHNLVDGTYNILYRLSTPNLANGIAAVMSVAGGVPSFTIPAARIPKIGNTTVTITKITNAATGCTNSSSLSKEFTVIPLPNISNLAATVANICQGQPTTAKLTGLIGLTDIAVTYTISGSNTVASQTVPLTVNAAGETSIPILETNIPSAGPTSLTITNVTNTITGCSSVANEKADFIVNSIPAIPIANDQRFCTSDNAKVANLLPQGAQYRWFDSATSTVPLANTTALVSGNYFVKEVNTVTGCESALKTITVKINTTPQINGAVAVIPPVCQGSEATVTFTATSTNLDDGDYTIRYNLSGSNVATAVSTILKVTGGIPTFTIESIRIPTAGDTTIEITNITNDLTTCTNTSTFSQVIEVKAAPDVSAMIVTVGDGCLGQNLNVDLSGLVNLTDITLSYAVTGANPISSRTIPLVVSDGKTSFSIPGADLAATGNNTLVLIDITNTGNSCLTTINTISKDFAINAIPNSPTASDQKFCETDLKTVADLTPNGSQYKWYDSAASTSALPSETLLVSGNYYVTETNGTTVCESNATPIAVVINTVAVPVLASNGNEFCGVDKPTILNLTSNIVPPTTNLTWYDAAVNGAIVPSTELLSEGATYYAINYDPSTICYSNPLPVTVTLTDCSATADNFFIPDGFSPNGDGVNETFQIVDIEFLFPNYTLEIFNRYGNMLFKGDINKPAWDGKNSTSSFVSGDAPTGVYFYIIYYNKDNLKPKQGQLYLNR